MKLLKFKYYRLSICFICLVIIFSESSSAEQFTIQTFTTREGLSPNELRAAAVDSSGYLWIATWDGLSRYYGYTLKGFDALKISEIIICMADVTARISLLPATGNIQVPGN